MENIFIDLIISSEVGWKDILHYPPGKYIFAIQHDEKVFLGGEKEADV
jgi:hypothetical protein